MADQSKQPAVTDPDNVPEVFCDGQINVTVSGRGTATLTFAHVRANPEQLFTDGPTEPISVIRARIAIPFQNLVGLRELLNGMIIQTEPAPASATSSPTKH